MKLLNSLSLEEIGNSTSRTPPVTDETNAEEAEETAAGILLGIQGTIGESRKKEPRTITWAEGVKTYDSTPGKYVVRETMAKRGTEDAQNAYVKSSRANRVTSKPAHCA